ncbi:unnamed protein product [Cyprideis torosa]|uniref:Phosphodiester glycosidase domain-containing protein n=1 Tax=Cyprideis torosa TaxID=163714 RepID=A0A7R8WF90_9CRUS|nr:unnamed protein product [Cyprideis torosa]CAG0891221.1 unnamed protein product [Cyprideis torosa]
MHGKMCSSSNLLPPPDVSMSQKISAWKILKLVAIACSVAVFVLCTHIWTLRIMTDRCIHLRQHGTRPELRKNFSFIHSVPLEVTGRIDVTSNATEDLSSPAPVVMSTRRVRRSMGSCPGGAGTEGAMFPRKTTEQMFHEEFEQLAEIAHTLRGQHPPGDHSYFSQFRSDDSPKVFDPIVLNSDAKRNILNRKDASAEDDPSDKDAVKAPDEAEVTQEQEEVRRIRGLAFVPTFFVIVLVSFIFGLTVKIFRERRRRLFLQRQVTMTYLENGGNPEALLEHSMWKPLKMSSGHSHRGHSMCGSDQKRFRGGADVTDKAIATGRVSSHTRRTMTAFPQSAVDLAQRTRGHRHSSQQNTATHRRKRLSRFRNLRSVSTAGCVMHTRYGANIIRDFREILRNVSEIHEASACQTQCTSLCETAVRVARNYLKHVLLVTTPELEGQGGRDFSFKLAQQICHEEKERVLPDQLLMELHHEFQQYEHMRDRGGIDQGIVEGTPDALAECLEEGLQKVEAIYEEFKGMYLREHSQALPQSAGMENPVFTKGTPSIDHEVRRSSRTAEEERKSGPSGQAKENFRERHKSNKTCPEIGGKDMKKPEGSVDEVLLGDLPLMKASDRKDQEKEILNKKVCFGDIQGFGTASTKNNRMRRRPRSLPVEVSSRTSSRVLLHMPRRYPDVHNRHRPRIQELISERLTPHVEEGHEKTPSARKYKNTTSTNTKGSFRYSGMTKNSKHQDSKRRSSAIEKDGLKLKENDSKASRNVGGQELKGYLATAIPSEVQVLAAGGEVGCNRNITDYATATGKQCEVVVTAGFYRPNTGACIGVVISNNRTIFDERIRTSYFVVTRDAEKAEIRASGSSCSDCSQAVAGVVQLTKNRKSVIKTSARKTDPSLQTTGTLKRFIELKTARTAIGVTPDGNQIILLSIEGDRSKLGRDRRGASLYDMAVMMSMLGASDSLNLDGGGSVAVGVNGTLVNRPINRRSLQNGARHFEESHERRVSSVLCLGKRHHV